NTHNVLRPIEGAQARARSGKAVAKGVPEKLHCRSNKLAKAPVTMTGAKLPGAAGIAGLRRAARRVGRELQRHTIHAVAQPGRRRSVLEDVPEMSAAAAAVHFGARHEERLIDRGADRVRERLPEARPPGAVLKLRLRGEQRQIAARAGKRSLALFLVERARAGTLGAVPAQHVVLRRRELRAPFGVAFLDLEFLRGCCF